MAGSESKTLRSRYRQEATQWDKYIQEGGVVAEHAESWLRTDTVDYWRHRRMYDYLNPLLKVDPAASWLTVGDGRYGRDAHYIHSMGGKTLASDISESLLKIGKERGYIDAYSVENLEALSFEDSSFDYVFAKECLHHLPRPWLGLYEMLRVADKGVALIEPYEGPLVHKPRSLAKTMTLFFLRKHFASLRRRLKSRPALRDYNNQFEEVGNYLFRFSERELEKTAIGFGCEMIAYLLFNDAYWQGLESSPLGSKDHAEIRHRIAQKDVSCQLGANQYSPGLIACLIFRVAPPEILQRALKESGYTLLTLPYYPERDAQDC